jgi:AcrR family transcriptional regulator
VTETTVFDRKPRMSAAARRSQLLAVALEKFAAGGYHDTSMGEIAKAAGVTKPVLYQHFQSKKDLYRELLDSTGQQLLADVAAGAASEAEPYDRVLAGFRAYFAFVCDRTAAFRLLFGGSARIAEEFRDAARAVEEDVAATIGQMIAAELDDEHRDLLGYAIVGLAEVVGRRWATTGTFSRGAGGRRSVSGEDVADRLAVRLADFVWAGLRGLPRPAPLMAGRDVAGSLR